MDAIDLAHLKIGLEDKFLDAKNINPNLEATLNGIKEHYDEYSKKCDSISKGLLDEVISSGLSEIHSVSRRIKDANSLLRKVIRKLSKLEELSKSPRSSMVNDLEKYRILNEHNYYKIMTDLIGFRILIRYRQEWSAVDKWIRSKFESNFISNWGNEYDPNPKNNYIVEKPKIYYKYADRDLYEDINKEDFDLCESKEGYNSVHYIINFQGCYVELQVRTILDEAWCECTHDVIYKGNNPSQTLKLLAKSMAEQVKAAEVITQIIYDGMHDLFQKEISTNPSSELDGNIHNRFDSKISKIIEKRLGV